MSLRILKKRLQNHYTVNLCNVLSRSLTSLTSNIGLLEELHQGYPECSRYILTLVWIHTTQTVVTIVLLDLQSLPHFPLEFVMNYGYRTCLIEFDFPGAVLAVKSHTRFVNFFSLNIGAVFAESGNDSFLCLTTIWGYTTRARYLVYTRVTVLRELRLVFQRKKRTQILTGFESNIITGLLLHTL